MILGECFRDRCRGVSSYGGKGDEGVVKER